MQFVSTRGQSPEVTFTEAVATGLAPDGGLYLPKTLPDLSGYLESWKQLDYPSLCEAFFSLFATDMPASVLSKRIRQSYKRFDHEQVAPLVALDDNLFVLELFHGPTLAFKDFALQLLGNLYEEQIGRTKNLINVLGATSGDTGSAAIHGLLGKRGVKIFILYPQGRVSPLQERQMTTTGAPNVYPIAIDGTFDDAQRIVKNLFGDLEFKRKHHLSAINSINLARILAQCVYYLWAWFRLPEGRRESVEFIVPTGNFGNVLAGWLVKRMGVSLGRFKVATNQNDILYRLFKTGRYQQGEVSPSLAPSMDIQVASNFERFLYYMVGEDPAKVRAIMATFHEKGDYTFEHFQSDDMTASRATDGDIERLIREVYDNYRYVADPHTACAFQEIDPKRNTVILSTAHPAKFPETIVKAIGVEPKAESLEAIKKLACVNYPLPATEEAVRELLEMHVGDSGSAE